MTNAIMELLNKQFELEEIDVKDFNKMKVGPMTFHLETYKANSLFNVSYLSGKALFGLMKMATIVITSNNKDIPIISYDRIKAGRKDVCIIEIYDTCMNKKEYPLLDKIKTEFIKYPKYEVKPAFSDDIKMSGSFSVYSKGSNNFDPLLKEFFGEIARIINDEEEVDENEKRQLNKKYVDGLLKNGGTSTDMFVKKIGKEKTAELYNKYLFCIE